MMVCLCRSTVPSACVLSTSTRRPDQRSTSREAFTGANREQMATPRDSLPVLIEVPVDDAKARSRFYVNGAQGSVRSVGHGISSDFLTPSSSPDRREVGGSTPPGPTENPNSPSRDSLLDGLLFCDVARVCPSTVSVDEIPAVSLPGTTLRFFEPDRLRLSRSSCRF